MMNGEWKCLLKDCIKLVVLPVVFAAGCWGADINDRVVTIESDRWTSAKQAEHEAKVNGRLEDLMVLTAQIATRQELILKAIEAN